MPRNIEVRRLIERSLGAEMAQLGFVRERLNMYRLRREGRITGVVTFRAKLFNDLEWNYSINIGVRHEDINHLLHDVCDDLTEAERALNLLVSQMLINVGYLTQENKFMSWPFLFEQPLQGVTKQMMNALNTFGMPFIDTHSRPRAFREALEDGRYTLVNQDLYLPALYIVEGEFALAESFLNEALRKRSARFDPEARWYRNFALKLQAMIAT